MYGINHSFPVTVAAGIAMAEWTRRHYASRSRERDASERPHRACGAERLVTIASTSTCGVCGSMSNGVTATGR